MISIKELSEKRTKDAIERRDWPALKSHLNDVGMSGATLETLLGYIRRASSLVLAYPNAKGEDARNKLMAALAQYVDGALGEEAAALVTSEARLLAQIEAGYRNILATLEACENSKLAPEVRVAAYLGHSIRQHAYVQKKFDETLRRRKTISFPGGPFITDDNGEPLSVDAAVESLVHSLTTTLIMEARRNGWLDSTGAVVLPPLPTVGEEEWFEAGLTEQLAMGWRRWRMIEERRRFLGGDWKQFTATGLPEWAPRDTQIVTLCGPEETAFLDYVANERLMDRLVQTFMEMMTETNVLAKVSGISKPVSLVPDGLVSSDEAHAAMSLSEIMGRAISDDVESRAGLRLVQWLRGYATLQQLASDHRSSCDDETGLTKVFTRTELLGVLQRCGLSQQSAAHFAESTTLKASSEDLFDSPLIKMQGDTLLMYGPALLNANLARVVLSTLSSLEEPLESKGPAFEADILSFFAKIGLQAQGFEVKRDGEKYEYDAVLAWGDFVFVFECKNRSLSNSRPRNAYYFDLGIRSAAKQVRRLADALRKYPDILMEKMNVDVMSKRIVPCVLNMLPFARPGEFEGVYCADSSMLKRFFENRFVNIKTPYQPKKNLRVLHRVPILSLWANAQPTPEDLLKQLEEPFQLKFLAAHTAIRPMKFPVGAQQIAVSTEFVRTEWNVATASAIAGVSASRIESEVATIGRQIREFTRKNKKAKRAKRKEKKRR